MGAGRGNRVILPMISFLRRIFRRSAKPAPAVASPLECERLGTRAWYDSILAMDEALPLADIRLPWPEFSHQGMASRCTGEAIEGVARSMRAQTKRSDLFPAIDAAEIYRVAKQLDGRPDHQAGSDLWAAAEAYCRMAASGIGWARLDLHPHVIRAVIRVPGASRAVAFGAAFHASDFYTGVSGRVMLPSHGAAGWHAMVLYGYAPEVSYRVNPFSGRISRDQCFWLRNTNTPHDREGWLYPIWRVQPKAGAVEAIVLTLPGESGFVPAGKKEDKA